MVNLVSKPSLDSANDEPPKCALTTVTTWVVGSTAVFGIS